MKLFVYIRSVWNSG